MKCFLCLLFFITVIFSNGQEIGQPLPEWQEGFLDLHHINTGRGNAAFYIFPDGTTMLLDAGEMNPHNERILSPRNSPIHPDYSKKPHEWVVDYIHDMHPKKASAALDYAYITHFHDDHYGAWYPEAPKSKQGDYVRTGMVGVGDLIPFGMVIDRGYPDYDYPVDMRAFVEQLKTDDPQLYHRFFISLENYWAFLDHHTKKGMKAATLKAGASDQIVLLKNKEAYPEFAVRGIKANSTIWTGMGTQTFEYYPEALGRDAKGRPSENTLSLAIRIDYGDFNYFTGGDMSGILDIGGAKWKDVETPSAPAIGEVDVATLNHHGNRDSQNEYYVSTLQPRVWVQQSWASDHPGPEVYRRITSKALYSGERDLFTTNLLEAAVNYVGPRLERAYQSTEGHIVVRVMPGGEQYYVIILADESAERLVTKVFGPYQTK